VKAGFLVIVADLSRPNDEFLDPSPLRADDYFVGLELRGDLTTAKLGLSAPAGSAIKKSTTSLSASAARGC
jgi:hypothetical protein